MKIWQKHILKKLLYTFFFFLFCLFFIYVITDLSAHGVRFFSKADLSEIILFYLHIFSSLLDLFLTLTFLLATLRVLFDLSSHREILALQMAGISKKALLFPFFLFAGALSFLGYINGQWFSPHAQEFANDFKTAYKAKKKPKIQKVYSVALEDDSELVYQYFNPKEKELVDVFWVKAPDDIWHMKTLNIASREGKFVNHLTRSASKRFEKNESFEKKYFTELFWDAETLPSHFVAYESRRISTLLMQACSYPADARIVFSHLYYKLLVPLTPFFVLLAIPPIALRYTRNSPTFLVACCSIFGFIALKIILDGMLILGENQVLPSYIAIFSPIALLLLSILPAFARMR